MRVNFHANKRHLSSTGIYCCYYPITENMSYVSCTEGRLTYIWSVKERFLLFHWQIFYIVKRLIRGNNDVNLRLLNSNVISLAWVRPMKTLWFVRNWITEGEDETGSSIGDVTNEQARPGVRQTNSERKGRLNVVGMWQTVGEGTLTPAHMLLGRFQVSHPPPTFTHGCQASLKETRSVPLGKSYKSGEDGKESASAGRLVKTRLLCCLVLVWGQLHKAWPERGLYGHINCKDWT